MRRVYQPPKFNRNWGPAILAGLGLTAFVFGVLPFTTAMSAARQKQLLLRQADIAAPPPVTDAEPPPPPPEPEEKPPEPPPQLAEAPQNIPMSADLDVAVGSGGALAGFGDFKNMMAAEGGTDAFDVADLEKPPEAIAQIAPKYPQELVKARIEGRVTVIFLLDETGKVQDPRVDSSTRPEFEKPALEAIRKWRFRPGQREGQAVKTYLRQPFRFTPPA
jgi:periplasmic protein TonB